MTGIRKSIAVAVIAMAGAAALVADGFDSAFVAWKVSGVSSADVLMVRTSPNAASRILVGYPEGVVLSMTGRCSGGVRLDDMQNLPRFAQRQLVQGKWCELWLDPYGTGEFRNGWVFGRYIAPA